jgi:FdhD protein
LASAGKSSIQQESSAAKSSGISGAKSLQKSAGKSSRNLQASKFAKSSPLIKSARSVEITQVVEWREGTTRRVEDYLAAEEPLEIQIGRKPLVVTMRTPGNDEELAAGFLLTEGIIEVRAQIAELTIPSRSRNLVRVKLARGARAPAANSQRYFAANSSCGVCGKASIDSVRARNIRPLNSGFRIGADVLCKLPDFARPSQEAFGRTGGLHAAALFDATGNLIVLREDIGRHNAVDKVIGWALLNERVPLNDCVLLASGRGGFEIVQKSIVAGIPVVASVSAPSSLAVELARRMRLTLVGFLRGQRFVIYSGEERIESGIS